MSSLKRKCTTDRDISPPSTKRKAASTVTSEAVANFFKPQSRKVPEKVAFSTVDDSLLVARTEGATAPRPKPTKIAAFDLDDTLISTKSGNTFAKGPDDWKWWHASVPSKLKALHEDGYAVIVVSNQSRVVLKSEAKKAGDMKSLSNFKAKVSALLTAIDLPMTVYAATRKDLFRKPRSGMWMQMLKDYCLSDPADIDHDSCIFVGDAAGREGDKAAKIRKDHSCSDRDFAANAGVHFKTPEEYFLGEAPKPFVRSFEPGPYLEVTLDTQSDLNAVLFTKKNELDIVLFCGSPGAGKSTFYWDHMQPLGYERVNQDILKTRAKCMKVAMQLLEDKTPVVVDNTNADDEVRAAWTGLAKRLHVPIRLIHFTAPAKLCEHNDTVRALSNGLMNPEKRTILPPVAFSGFTARYREPKIEEGFQDITRVDFRFHGNDEQKSLWSKYWIT